MWRPALRTRQKDYSRKPNNSGFSLIEISIFLLVVAVMAGAALNFGNNQQGFARFKQTTDKLDVIQKALATYVRINGRLPCPAKGDLARTNASFGVEDCTTTIVPIGTAADPDILVGILPAVTLGISTEFVTDGWERRYTYAVEERFIDVNTFHDTMENDPDKPGDRFIDIVDGMNTAVVRSNWAVYVVMSFGEDGIGAWPRDGGAAITGTTTDVGELNNNDYTDKQFAVTLRSRGFDDMVRYRTKSLLLLDAGKPLGGKTRRSGATTAPVDDCVIADYTIRPINNPNDGATITNRALEGPVGCEDEAAYKIGPPAHALDGSNRINPLPMGAAYQAVPRDNACITREVRLAEQIRERCLYLR